jgi:hypothetical protein
LKEFLRVEVEVNTMAEENKNNKLSERRGDGLRTLESLYLDHTDRK